MFNNLGQIADLMKNMGKMREGMEKAAEKLAQLEVEGSAGGGSVVARVSGRMEVISLRIDPKLISDNDGELLEDLILSAVNQGLAKAREAAGESFSSMAGGLPIPGMSHLFGPGAGGSS